MALFIGTSGWAYKEWKPAFYPEALPQARFLEHLASVLGAVEVNATFHRLQSAATVARWAGEVPAGFRFAVKAHEAITAGDPLGAPRILEPFLKSIAPLGARLGVLLLQVQPERARDDAGLERLLARLASSTLAFELRSPAWDHDEVRAKIHGAGATLCFTDTEGVEERVPARLPPGRCAYVRLRAERYTEAARAAWLALLVREAGSRDVYAFARHEGVPAGDPLAGVTMAQWMRERTR